MIGNPPPRINAWGRFVTRPLPRRRSEDRPVRLARVEHRGVQLGTDQFATVRDPAERGSTKGTVVRASLAA